MARKAGLTSTDANDKNFGNTPESGVQIPPPTRRMTGGFTEPQVVSRWKGNCLVERLLGCTSLLTQHVIGF